MKGMYGVFQVEGGSSSGYSRPGENQGWNSRRGEESFHPRYQQRGGKEGWNHYRREEPRRYWHDWAEQDDHEEDHTQLSENPKSKGSASSPRVNDLLSRILDKVEGFDDLLKGMRDDFSSLNSKVNSHPNAIKTLEVTCSGKMAKGNVMEDEDP
ncbi:hypothetical protein KY290_033770 [Solanum tuberosum]|uniref:Integrase core domain containing protein n=1 Tax=Solanum tuberosum TaxID=4113 RepID=A0ABQ7U1B0_SOLTU|nr:hypothetical protein KY290_033770 [Solanum tuberosum]